jgi:internalin A
MSAPWERFELTLQHHVPAMLASFRPPASAKQIEAAEQAMGVMLPDDVRAAYLRHDGSTRDTNLFGGMNWWGTLEEILECWRTRLLVSDKLKANGNYVDVPDDETAWAHCEVRPEWWNRHWIPIGLSGTGDIAYVDLLPGPKGTKGQIIFDTGMSEAVVMASSLNEFLETIVQRLESGAMYYENHWMSSADKAPIYNWANCSHW